VALDLTVIAEGIENAGQARHLQRLGCQMGQGYFLAWPLDSAQLEQRVRSAGVAGEALAG
jgi:EAL domain-containing protein (putative c-di-GMP-specific phosphodiesterase class I)